MRNDGVSVLVYFLSFFISLSCNVRSSCFLGLNNEMSVSLSRLGYDSFEFSGLCLTCLLKSIIASLSLLSSVITDFLFLSLPSLFCLYYFCFYLGWFILPSRKLSLACRNRAIRSSRKRIAEGMRDPLQGKHWNLKYIQSAPNVRWTNERIITQAPFELQYKP